MKRIISLLLCALAVLSLGACGKEKEPDKTEPATKEQAQVETRPATFDQAPEPTEPSDTDMLKAFITAFDKTPVIDLQTLFEDEKFTVTLNALAYDRINGPELQVKVTSRFDKDVIMQFPYMVVNGCMIEPDDESMSDRMEITVPAGKTTEGVINIPYFYLAISDIRVIRTIEFPLEFCEPGTYDELYQTSLLTLTTSAKQDGDEQFSEEGQTAYDKDGIKIIIKGLNTDHTYSNDDKLVVSMRNSSDRDVIVKAKTLCINGYDDFIPKMHPYILSGKQATNFVRILQRDKQDCGISDIDSIEVSFTITTADGKLIATTDPISVDPVQSKTIRPATPDSAEK